MNKNIMRQFDLYNTNKKSLKCIIKTGFIISIVSVSIECIVFLKNFQAVDPVSFLEKSNEFSILKLTDLVH